MSERMEAWERKLINLPELMKYDRRAGKDWLDHLSGRTLFHTVIPPHYKATPKKWPNMILHFIIAFIKVFKTMFTINFPIHAIPFLLFKLK
jgi:hypothetical protein